MAEPAKELHFSKEKVKTINHALRVLNDAADFSSDEIRTMVGKDYKKLKKILTEARPTVRDAFGEIKVATVDTVNDATHNIDVAVHQKPWPFIGGVALCTGMLGFYFGRKSKPR